MRSSRRLGLLLGTIGAGLWLILAGIWVVLFRRQVLDYYFLGALISFVAPFLLTEGIAWAVRSFRAKR